MAGTKVMWLYSGHWSWIWKCHVHLAMTNRGDCHFKFFPNHSRDAIVIEVSHFHVP